MESNKKIENAHTFLPQKARVTEIRDTNFTEEGIEEILGELNEHTAAKPNNVLGNLKNMIKILDGNTPLNPWIFFRIH